MVITIEADANEIAALVVALQGRQVAVVTRAASPLEITREAVRSAIGDIEQEKPS